MYERRKSKKICAQKVWVTETNQVKHSVCIKIIAQAIRNTRLPVGKKKIGETCLSP